MNRIIIALLILPFVSGCMENGINNNKSVLPQYQPVVDLAKNDLAKRLNITIHQIQFIKQEKVDWPDTSLGYPEEGKMYAQVITPGFRIILQAGDTLYEYHSDYKRVVGPKEPQ